MAFQTHKSYSPVLLCPIYNAGKSLLETEAHKTKVPKAAAQEALILNGFEMDGLKIIVLISDPTRKKNRSDAGARELRVTGVIKTVTKAELEKLFSPVSHLQYIGFFA